MNYRANYLLLLTFLFLFAACTEEKKKVVSKDFDFISESNRKIDKIGFALGYKYAQALEELKFEQATQKAFIDGAKAGFEKKHDDIKGDIQFSARQVDGILGDLRSKKSESNLVKGKAYIDDLLKSDDSYIKSASGLVYKILKQGEKNQPIQSSFISMNYESSHLNDSVYETTMKGNPRVLPYKGIFSAWKEAFRHAGVGGKIMIISPPSLTYGNQGALPQIQPGEYLKYKMNFFKYFLERP